MKLNEFLAASLPYRLWVRFWDVNNKNNKNYSIASPYRIGNYYDEFESEICRAIPIVRSLDSLTKPITQANYNEGKLFVPLYRLLENSGFNVSKMTEAEILEYAEVYSNIDLIQLSDLHLYLIWHFDLLDEGIEKVLVTDEFNPY